MELRRKSRNRHEESIVSDRRAKMWRSSQLEEGGGDDWKPKQKREWVALRDGFPLQSVRVAECGRRPICQLETLQ